MDGAVGLNAKETDRQASLFWVSGKNELPQICRRFSRMDFFLKSDYFSTIGLYFGTRAFMMLHAST